MQDVNFLFPLPGYAIAAGFDISKFSPAAALEKPDERCYDKLTNYKDWRDVTWDLTGNSFWVLIT